MCGSFRKKKTAQKQKNDSESLFRDLLRRDDRSTAAGGERDSEREVEIPNSLDDAVHITESGVSRSGEAEKRTRLSTDQGTSLTGVLFR
jgi:hypothetical protein